MRFIGREQDMAFFERCYGQEGAQLVVLYGRRRVGKTELLRRFSEGKPAVWYSCTKNPDALQLKAFSARLLAKDQAAARFVDSFESWDRAFEEIPYLDMEGKKLVIIDEFPYAVYGNHALPSILQNVWDQSLSRENVMVVLCGSSIGFMENELLSEKNPLYGRATGIWKLEPLGYDQASRFFPDYSPQERLEAYCILGGIPHYLNQFNPGLSIGQNVVENVFSRGCPLYTEADFMLREELREPSVYNAVLGAVACGETELNGIGQKAMLDSRVANTYLSRLRELHVAEKEFSVQAGQQERSKRMRGLWYVSDNFVRFWYAAACPYISDLEMGDAQGVWEHFVSPRLNGLLSRAFEDICCQWIRRRNIAGELPFRASRIGRWWSGASEIDVVAMGDFHAHLLCECKFKNSPMGLDTLRSLAAKEERFFQSGDGWLWLFSKNGYEQDVDWEDAAGDMAGRVRLVDVEELEL